MKTRRRKRPPEPEETTGAAPTTIFSSDLLTPEEERGLLADFWETKSELVRVLVRSFPKRRQQKPAMAPRPMAPFNRDHRGNPAPAGKAPPPLHDRDTPPNPPQPPANTALAAHPADLRP